MGQIGHENFIGGHIDEFKQTIINGVSLHLKSLQGLHFAKHVAVIFSQCAYFSQWPRHPISEKRGCRRESAKPISPMAGYKSKR